MNFGNLRVISRDSVFYDLLCDAMMPMKVVRIFESEGWGWGGEWHRPDAMHFEAVE